MRIPTLQGIIKRRILVNYLAEPKVIQKILPPGFRPKLQNGYAIAGICLIRLERIRPKFAPAFVGLASENAAHRIAVLWKDENGKTLEGVYIPRRDTDSFVNSTVGGRLFPGEHHKAEFEVSETENRIAFSMKSDDKTVFINLAGKISDCFPENSIFASLAEASNFFEKGFLGYSATKNEKSLDGIVLDIKDWTIKPLDLEFVESSFYDDTSVFPKDSIELDHALLMQNVRHEWRSAPRFELK